MVKKVANKLRASGQIQDKDRYIPISEAKKQMVAMLEELNKEMNPIKECEYQIYGKEHWNFVGKCQDVICSKITKLKENMDV